MSTKSSIKYRHRGEGVETGFHLYDDLMDGFGDDATDYEDTPVYLEVEGVHVELETLGAGAAVVTLRLPRELARALGLLGPLPAASGNAAEARSDHPKEVL